MVAVLDVLEHKGIVERRPGPADRRRNVAELTGKGPKSSSAGSRRTARYSTVVLLQVRRTRSSAVTRPRWNVNSDDYWTPAPPISH